MATSDLHAPGEHSTDARAQRPRVGDPLPAVMVLADLAHIFGVGARRAQQLRASGAFEVFELLPRIGAMPRYSGKRVQAWLDGELAAPSRVFGGTRRRS